MRKLILSLLCIALYTQGVRAQDNKNAPPGVKPIPPVAQSAMPGQADPDAGKFRFKEETHDYGEVPEGPLAECDFVFKNVGKKPIVISEAHGSCGCTVPKWPTEPVLPKHTGIIHVSYNTTGRVGVINKDVYITSDAQQNPMKLHITGTVKAKPDDGRPVSLPPPPPPNSREK